MRISSEHAPPAIRFHDPASHGVGTDRPWAPVLAVGGQLTLEPEHPHDAVRWSLAEPDRGAIAPDGTLVARRPGPLVVLADVAGVRNRALVAVVADPPPAIAFQSGWPLAEGVRPGTRIIRSAEAWRAFWHDEHVPPAPAPPVDFVAHDAVVWVRDEVTFVEHAPVLTHVSHDARRVHLVAPAVAHPFARRAGAQAAAFLTGKLPADAAIVVHTLCAP
jgi:hypothetical protein